MAQLSQLLTRQRFGNVIQMYIPMYLSNECKNICTYCGFSFNNRLPRLTLNEKQIKSEIEVIKKWGFEHILILTGEDNQNVGMPYFKKVLPLIKKYFTNVSMEVQPLKTENYQELMKLGLDGVFVYQETYDQEKYKKHHPLGKKSNFYQRLKTPDQLGQANISKIGIGVLLGLTDWRVDSFFCALHLDYLKKKYWQTRYSLSFPRIRPAEGVDQEKYCINDKDLAQLIFAYRLFDGDLELSLSTRETAYFRQNMVPLGITHLSAGSKTNPGGYCQQAKDDAKEESLSQFDISDNRDPLVVAKDLVKANLEPVWKDWDKALNG